jgi:SAM-dependent methyltransferase
VKLDLACGHTPKKGYDGVDLYDHGQRFVGDLFGTPWLLEDTTKFPRRGKERMPDSWVSKIHCSHFVEHVPDLVSFMNEIWRVCKPGAEVIIAHPYQHSHRAWQDPTHVRAINEITWKYFDANERKAIVGEGYQHFDCDFDVELVNFLLNPAWMADGVDEESRLHAIHYAVNVVDDLVVTLRVRK